MAGANHGDTGGLASGSGDGGEAVGSGGARRGAPADAEIMRDDATAITMSRAPTKIVGISFDRRDGIKLMKVNIESHRDARGGVCEARE